MILTFSFYGCRKEIARIEETAPAEEEEKKEIKEQEIEKPEEVGETIETRAEGLTSKDPDTATMNDLKDAIELASEAQEAGLDDIAEDLISWAKEALSVIASQALLKSPCDAEMGDIKNAVEIASEAQKLGLDELADRLLSWARNSLRSIASRSIDSGASEKERFDLAQTAQELGLDDLADDILEGREITPVYTYGVHAELKGIHPYTEITYHFIVDAYTCEQDVHFGWNGKIL